MIKQSNIMNKDASTDQSIVRYENGELFETEDNYVTEFINNYGQMAKKPLPLFVVPQIWKNLF